jgi:hypothetical protein
MTDPAKLALAALLTIPVLVGACESAGPTDTSFGPTDTSPGPTDVQSEPQVIIPADVRSTQTADEVAQRMLAIIARNEERLGRRLAQPRILHIQLLREGEVYWLHHLDGTGPPGHGLGPSEGPGWVVEAVGTMLPPDRGQTSFTKWGIHGWHLWEDAGGESYGFSPCGGTVAIPPEQLDGSCS